MQARSHLRARMSVLALRRAAVVVVIAFIAGLALAVMPVSATVVPGSYSEPLDGDLPGTGALTVLTLIPGSNGVSGTFGTAGGINDFDSFAFIVPDGMQVVSGQVAVFDAFNDVFSTTWVLRSGATSINSGQGTFIENITVFPFGTDSIDNVPLGPGTYGVSHSFFSGEDPSSANYSFSFTVTPEPASLSALAIGALCLMRRRRRR